MLIDTAEVIFRGGHGGNGITSFGKKERSGPNGGNGGLGGNLYVVATSDLTLLNQFSRKTIFFAGNGYSGGKNKMSGLRGKDLEILLPFGTSIIDKETGKVIYELDKTGDRQLICRGGLGGRGNWEFKSPTKRSPTYHQMGLPGEEKSLILSLKLIADFGLVGLPNSGKSSLLNELTNANAKIANYPFTTLSPNLGVCGGKFLADIPGLIEGASEGRGLGIRFLKHIEKVGTLLHCISSESSDLIKDYDTVRIEMGKYSPELLKKTEVILLTKSDLIDKKTAKKDIETLKTTKREVLTVSIYDWESIEKLKDLIIRTSN
jgi:GTP-binding protein